MNLLRRRSLQLSQLQLRKSRTLFQPIKLFCLGDPGPLNTFCIGRLRWQLQSKNDQEKTSWTKLDLDSLLSNSVISIIYDADLATDVE